MIRLGGIKYLDRTYLMKPDEAMPTWFCDLCAAILNAIVHLQYVTYAVEQNPLHGLNVMWNYASLTNVKLHPCA